MRNLPKPNLGNEKHLRARIVSFGSRARPSARCPHDSLSQTGASLAWPNFLVVECQGRLEEEEKALWCREELCDVDAMM